MHVPATENYRPVQNRRSSAPSEDKAHYEYLLARVNAALQNQK